MFYALWDLDSGNIISDFDSEADALQLVTDLLSVNTPDFAEALSLERTGEDGSTVIVAVGAALAERAQAALGASRRTL